MSLSLQDPGPAGGGPAVVLLHGVGAAGWMWRRQVRALSDLRCLNVDLPGHGGSSAVPWVSVADAADRVADLVRRHSETGTAHVVGLSLGGHVALSMLKRHADTLERVLVSGVTVEPWPHRWLVGAQARLTTAQLRNPRVLAAQARRYGLVPAEEEEFLRTVRLMSGQTYRRVLSEVAGSTLPEELWTVQKPVLSLAGSQESSAIRQAVQTIDRVMPQGLGRIVPGVGHSWNLEAPELFSATVRAWIQDLPLPAQLRLTTARS